MLSDLSKWKIVNGKLDTSEGDKVIEDMLKEDKMYRKSRNIMSRPRIRLTAEQRKQHIKEYQHNYYLRVTKPKRRKIRDDRNRGICKKRRWIHTKNN